MIERICRAVCIADGVDPDAEGCGLGAQMPAGERYPLWKAREKQARASLKALLIEDVVYYVDGKPNATIQDVSFNERIGAALAERLQ